MEAASWRPPCNYDVFTVRDGRVVAMRACRDRDEALAIAGIE
jgi:hypothetical protein